MTAITLDPSDIAIAAVVLVMDGLLSIRMRLGVHRALAIASLRMLLQLTALGFVLRAVFSVDAPWLTAALILAMTLAAAREAAARPRRRLLRGHYVVSFASVAAPALLTCVFATASLLPGDSGWSPRFVIPVAGILLGNVLNAVSLGMAGILERIGSAAPEIEAQLMLGRSFREASGSLERDAIRHAMVPLVNQMSAAGIITMPGIMAGQVLAGMDPLQAATYQIVLLLLLAGGSGLAAIGAVRLVLRRLTDGRDRLRLDRVVVK
jgi:putative ABC transport system permease protein